MWQLTEAMRDATADPPPTTVDIDALIAGKVRRGNRLRVLAVAGVVALAAGTAPVVAIVGEPPLPARPLVRDYYDPAPSPTPADRTGLQGWTGGAASLAEAALPEGYRLGERPIESWGGKGEFALLWTEIIGGNEQHSQLLVYLKQTGDPEPPPGEVCAAPPTSARLSGDELTCEPVTVDGLELRVGTARAALPQRTPPEHFDFPVVSRHGDGWATYVWELPYQHPMHRRDSLPELVDRPAFTVGTLATIAAHPDLVP